MRRVALFTYFVPLFSVCLNRRHEFSSLCFYIQISTVICHISVQPHRYTPAKDIILELSSGNRGSLSLILDQNLTGSRDFLGG